MQATSFSSHDFIQLALDNQVLKFGEFVLKSGRIMDSDLVTIITKVLTMDSPKPLYIATDYLPVTSLELTTWLSKQVDETLPEIDSEKTEISGKRLHSNIPLAWLQYPDWQAGYRDILQHQK